MKNKNNLQKGTTPLDLQGRNFPAPPRPEINDDRTSSIPPAHSPMLYTVNASKKAP